MGVGSRHGYRSHHLQFLQRNKSPSSVGL
jgi:hypothetical protein